MAVLVVEVVVDDGVEEADHAGEEVGRDEAGAAGDGGLDGIEALGDVGARHPEGERFEGGFEITGDIAHGVVGRAERVDDLGGGGAVGGEWDEDLVHDEKLDARDGWGQGGKCASPECCAQRV
ncbi:MAG: hypothetical protein WC718_13195 [Phycisphaerales bacterium]